LWEREKSGRLFSSFLSGIEQNFGHPHRTQSTTRTHDWKVQIEKEENSKKMRERDTVDLSKRCAGGKPTEQTHDREYSICLRTKPVNFGRSEGKTKHSASPFGSVF
jgi:hypothetical protein